MRKNGFSLVELSIVLAVIGLVAGGITMGKGMVRASTVKSVAIDLQRYRSAALAFKDQYGGWPGDLINATNFWGIAGTSTTGNDTACYSVSKTSQATCNGDGSGKIDSPTADIYMYHERFQVWQHLANAGLIEGQYTGVTASASSSFSINSGKNMPASKMKSGYYDMTYLDDPTSYYTFTDRYYHGMMVRICNTVVNCGVFKPDEAFQIDSKYDDGKPGYGKIITDKHSVSACVTSDTASDAVYDLSRSDPICMSVWFIE